MQTIKTIDLDIAKSVVQVHGIDAEGILRRQLKRRYVLAFFEKLPPGLGRRRGLCLVNRWSRELWAVGHRPEARRLSIHLLRPGLASVSARACSRAGTAATATVSKRSPLETPF